MTAVRCSISPIRDGVQLRASITMPALPGEEIAIVEAGDPRIWVSEPEATRKGGKLDVVADLVSPGGKSMALNRGALRFTVLGGGHAVDIRGCTAN